MEQYAGQVVTAGPGAEKPGIDHVGQPGDGKPVGAMKGGECPAKSFPGKPGLYMEVLGNVVGIVEIDKVEPGGFPVNYTGNNDNCDERQP